MRLLLCSCPAYAAERTSLFHRVEQEFITSSISPSAVNQHLLSSQQRANQFDAWNAKDDLSKAQWLLCYDENKEMVVAVNDFLVSAFIKRTKEIKRLVALAKRNHLNVNGSSNADSKTSGAITNAEHEKQIRASRLFHTTTDVTQQIDFTTSRLIKRKPKPNRNPTTSNNGDDDDDSDDADE